MILNNLRTRILFSFILIILILGLAIGFLGFYLIRNDILDRSQKQVEKYLTAARIEYLAKLDKIKMVVTFIKEENRLVTLRDEMKLDYLIVEKNDKNKIQSEIAIKALDGEPEGGTRVMSGEEMDSIGENFREKTHISIINTPKAKPSNKTSLDSVLVLEYAIPVKDKNGNVTGVVYGGRILNRNFELVDRIHSLVFADSMYDGKPIGTVTIFQDDVRIATNVLTAEGKRAIGTRVSSSVYDAVLMEGKSWLDRAFVVTDWYLSGYEPIKNINGKIIGILYVGLLEKPFNDIFSNTLVLFLIILTGALLLGAGLSYFLAFMVSRPVDELMKAMKKVSNGHYSSTVDEKVHVKEFSLLTSGFNTMARELEIRESSLKMLNKRYIDLIGFVSHELKGILSSTILNAYTVRDGFLGMINFKQKKALDSITRNLDYLAATIKNFLNLSRIEKGELSIRRSEFLLEDVFDMSLEAFQNSIANKEMVVENRLERDIKASGDRDLITVVVNNLINNAIKYGSEKGKIILTANANGEEIKVGIYNDGLPFTDPELKKLFKRFSRLNRPEEKRIKGTGLGLFIVKEIVENHGGKIWAEPGEQGNSFLFTIPGRKNDDGNAVINEKKE
ncbi:MAG: cache domain-containing protein [Spirochaetales bacterium]|nr:cache domain-containing protein [Spirochaetales bacterium]